MPSATSPATAVIWGPTAAIWIGGRPCWRSLGANIGVGILIGEYIGGFLSDAIGRKWTLILSAFIEGIFIWPIALTHNFGWLLLWNLLFALGMGMLLALTRRRHHGDVP